jgi:hypothetical protein
MVSWTTLQKGIESFSVYLLTFIEQHIVYFSLSLRCSIYI